MTPLLTADCVGKSFSGRRILSSASLRAEPGRLKVLLGRNGAGKSTLLRIAAGCVQPDTGSVHWNGEAIMKATLPNLARLGLFYLPDHDLLSNAFSVRAQLDMIHRQFGGLHPKLAAERMGVAALLDRKPWTLSGGELRRVELAADTVGRSGLRRVEHQRHHVRTWYSGSGEPGRAIQARVLGSVIPLSQR
jgi:ABC-type multidrug transport system ATPase subunit